MQDSICTGHAVRAKEDLWVDNRAASRRRWSTRLGCDEVFSIIAFAKLTWRKLLRGIETCMTVNQDKQFHMGLKSPPARSNLTDALNLRDSCIYRALAERLIAHGHILQAHNATVLDFDFAVYALDSTAIESCVRLSGWALLR